MTVVSMRMFAVQVRVQMQVQVQVQVQVWVPTSPLRCHGQCQPGHLILLYLTKKHSSSANAWS